MDLFEYHPYYCEENIWRLCANTSLKDLERMVVFISNPGKTCAMWHMKAARDCDSIVAWDYHVILLARKPGKTWQVYDLDTDLGVPVDAEHYLDKSFRPDTLETLQPMFRLVDADLFQELFSSDRSHMATSSQADPKNPPEWSPIFNGLQSNLFQFVDMEKPFVGDVMNLAQLRRFISVG